MPKSMPAPIAEGPTVSVSCRFHVEASESAHLHLLVANNFWGKDDAGVNPLLERMQNAKVTCDELKAFYNGETL